MAEGQGAENAGEPKSGDLYARHVQDFVETAKRDLNEAIQRFGFTIWHSLPPEEAAKIKQQLGVQPLEAVDLYNRGTARAQQGDHAGAEADLRAALQKDPDHALAAYNYAVCLENLNRPDDARRAYEQYLAILERAANRTDVRRALGLDFAEEKARIRQHLETLA